MTYEDDPKYHWEGDHSYGDGAEINGEDFDKLTGETGRTGIIKSKYIFPSGKLL